MRLTIQETPHLLLVVAPVVATFLEYLLALFCDFVFIITQTFLS